MVSRYKGLIIAIIIAILVLCSVIIYIKMPREHAEEEGEGVSSKEVVIVDALNRSIGFNETPSRVVSLAPSITEIVFSLDLEDRLVGVDSNSYNTTYLGINGYCREHGIADVGGYWWSMVNVEKIISLNPDLILADKGAHIKLNQTFAEYGLKVVYLNGGSAESVNDVYSDIKIIGRIFNVSNKADNLINSIEEKIASARQYIKDKGLEGTRILIVVGVYENNIYVVGKNTFIADLIERIGLENAVDISGWPGLGIETIMESNPDIIFIEAMGIDEAVVEELGLPTICNNIVYLNTTETDLLSRPGPRIGDAVLVLAYRVYGVYGGS